MHCPDRDLAAFAFGLLEGLFKSHPLGYIPELRWKLLRVTAGQANHRGRWIGLSTILLVDRDRLADTLRHEYAHLLAVSRHGPKSAGHGSAWKQAMRDLGLKPDVHHSFEVRRNHSMQQVAYECARCGTVIVRKKRLPSRRKYIHTGCGGLVRFSGARRVTDGLDVA